MQKPFYRLKFTRVNLLIIIFLKEFIKASLVTSYTVNVQLIDIVLSKISSIAKLFVIFQ